MHLSGVSDAAAGAGGTATTRAEGGGVTLDARLHPMSVLEGRDDGYPFRHELLPTEPHDGHRWCAECRIDASRPHPLAASAKAYAASVVVEACRGVVLCRSRACREAHLLRHMEQRRIEEARAAEAEREAKRSGRTAAA